MKCERYLQGTDGEEGPKGDRGEVGPQGIQGAQGQPVRNTPCLINHNSALFTIGSTR